MLAHFNKADRNKPTNKSLANSHFNTQYSYSDIFNTLLATYTTNGSYTEDSKHISGQISKKADIQSMQPRRSLQSNPRENINEKKINGN